MRIPTKRAAAHYDKSFALAVGPIVCSCFDDLLSLLLTLMSPSRSRSRLLRSLANRQAVVRLQTEEWRKRRDVYLSSSTGITQDQRNHACPESSKGVGKPDRAMGMLGQA